MERVNYNELLKQLDLAIKDFTDELNEVDRSERNPANKLILRQLGSRSVTLKRALDTLNQTREIISKRCIPDFL